MLQRVLLSTVAPLFAGVGTLTLRQGSALPSLVQSNRVILMLLAMRTVSPYFFGNVHGYRYQLSIKETHAFLYLFRTARNPSQIPHVGCSCFLRLISNGIVNNVRTAAKTNANPSNPADKPNANRDAANVGPTV